MKRSISLLLSVLLVFSVCSAEDQPDYLGTWAISDEFMEGHTEISVFQLNPDHSVFFMLQWFFTGQDEPGLESKWVGTWEESGNDSFIVYHESKEKSSHYSLVNKNEIVSNKGRSYYRVGSVPFSYHEYLKANPTDPPESAGTDEIVYAEINYDALHRAELADIVDESYYPGIWVNISDHANGTGETMTILHLSDNHDVFFTIQSINNDGSEGLGRSAHKSWSASGNNIHVVIGNRTSKDLRVVDQNHMYDVDRPYDIYTRLNSEVIGDQHE